MRVLIDECLPKSLARLLPPHDCRTVQQMGWAGIKNGELLKLAEAQFEAFITHDKNLPHQQNVKSLNLAVVVLRRMGTRRQQIEPNAGLILVALSNAEAGKVTYVGPESV